MNFQHMDPVLITGMVAAMLWLFDHGWLLPGFVLAGLILALLAHFYGKESPQPPLSKEEDLAMWGVKWELENPAPMPDKPASSQIKPQTSPHLQGGRP